jgi:zinc/manganese transport system substrate-binding protein
MMTGSKHLQGAYMKKIITGMIASLFIFMFSGSAVADTQLSVVTSMTALEEITRDIGGNRIKISNIGPHDQDLHFVVARPSHVQLLMNAKVLVHTGLMGEPWLPALIEAAGNRHIFPGHPGDCDASINIKVLDKPDVITREMGDVHPGGNPHFWLDPVNIITAGANIRNRLSELMPEHKAEFDRNFNEFAGRWRKLTLDWAKRLEPLKPIRVIDYHVSWSYFYDRFKIEKVDSIEPKPGIKPSGAHIAKVIAAGKAKNVDFLLAEPFFPQRDIQMVARELKVPTLIIQQSPGGRHPKMENIFETIVSFIEKVKRGEVK